jgi:nitroreductase
MSIEQIERPIMARQADHPIEPWFLERWSPRAFDGSAISDEHLLTIFEAARWAPSAFNYQPWRFLYTRRGDADWARFLDLLIPFNQAWAGNAAVLIYILSDTLIDRGKPGDPQPLPDRGRSGFGRPGEPNDHVGHTSRPGNSERPQTAYRYRVRWPVATARAEWRQLGTERGLPRLQETSIF